MRTCCRHSDASLHVPGAAHGRRISRLLVPDTSQDGTRVMSLLRLLVCAQACCGLEQGSPEKIAQRLCLIR